MANEEMNEPRTRVIIVRDRETKRLLGVYWGDSESLWLTLAAIYGSNPIEYRDAMFDGGVAWENGPTLPLKEHGPNKHHNDLAKYEHYFTEYFESDLAQRWPSMDEADLTLPWEPFIYREGINGKLV